MKIQLQRELNGLILDIGGGGEGVISQVYPGQVIAIDKKLTELAEAPGLAVKIVMDAGKMAFTDNCFDNVTAFYSFMYMLKSEHSDVISEIKRVLRPKGHLHIWDAEIKEANPFIIDLDINIDEHSLHTKPPYCCFSAAQNPGRTRSEHHCANSEASSKSELSTIHFVDSFLVHTTYGVYKDDAFQDAEYFKRMMQDFGFLLIKETNSSGHFYQCWQKN